MLKTERGYETPGVRQIAVFLRNRVGELSDILRHLEKQSLCVHAISVADSIDYAVIRIIVDNADTATRVLETAGFAVTESRVLSVSLPSSRDSLLQLCRALLGAEINIHYAYPMLTRPNEQDAVVIHTDEPDTAVEVLRRRGFPLIDEYDLRIEEVDEL